MVRESSQNASPPFSRGISNGWAVDSMGARTSDLWFLRYRSRCEGLVVCGHSNYGTYFLSLSEYLLTDTKTKSPGGFAIPAPGLGNSTKSLGEKTSGPSLKLKWVGLLEGIGDFVASWRGT